MRLVRPLPLIPTAVAVFAAAFLVLVGLLGALSPTASAQDSDLVIVIPPVEVEPTETTTTVMQVEPTGAIVAALTITVEFPDVVFLAATEPLVNGFCEVDGNQVRFSAFEVTGWATTTDLCRITLRGGQVAGNGTPTIAISVAADPVSERLTGTTQPGTITVGSAPVPPTVVTATPTPEPTVEPTPEPTPEDTTDVASDDPTSQDPDATADDAATDAGDSNDAGSGEETDPGDDSATEEGAAEDGAAEDGAAEEPATEDVGADADADGRGGRVEGDAVDPDNDSIGTDDGVASDEAVSDEAVSDDAPSDDASSNDTAPEAEASTDGDVAQPDPETSADAASETASPTPLPPLPAEGSNQALLIALVAAALFAVGALLGLGARSANRDSGTPG